MIMQPTGLHILPDTSFQGAPSDGKVLRKNVGTSCYGCLEIVSLQYQGHYNNSFVEVAEQFPEFLGI